MQKWEYKGVMNDGDDKHGEKRIEELNRLGGKGWRAVHFCGNGDVVMEREIREPDLGVDGKVLNPTPDGTQPE